MAIFKCPLFFQVLIGHTGVLQGVPAPHLVLKAAEIQTFTELELWYDSENSRTYEKNCHLILLIYFQSLLLY